MTEERFIQILSDDSIPTDLLHSSEDNALDGLLLLRRYLPTGKLIAGSEHDKLYSVYVGEIVQAGITEEDATVLKRLNWCLGEGDEYLQCYT